MFGIESSAAEVPRRFVALLELLHGLLSAGVGLPGLAGLLLRLAGLARLDLLGIGFVLGLIFRR